MTAPKRIGIAVVEHSRRYLVGLRGPGGPLAGFAEFPGGKCLDEESPFDCAVRECFEESGLAVVPQRLLQRVEFEYPHGRVDLHFVLCHPADSAEVSDRHQEFYWVKPRDLPTMRFPEANAQLISRLAESDTTGQETAKIREIDGPIHPGEGVESLLEPGRSARIPTND